MNDYGYGRYFDPAPAAPPAAAPVEAAAPVVDDAQAAAPAPAGVANEAPPVDAPAPVAGDGGQAPAPVVDDGGQAPAPVVDDGQAPVEAAAPESAVQVPAVGSIVRYRVNDIYSDPPRERDQLVIVTNGPDQTGAVRGVSLGYADAVEASFRPEDLRPA